VYSSASRIGDCRSANSSGLPADSAANVAVTMTSTASWPSRSGIASFCALNGVRLSSLALNDMLGRAVGAER
jgi:hypothetical protein